MLSSLCSNSSMEASGPSRITTAPACPRSDLRGAIHPFEVKRMLHDILWNGLRKDLKDASGHKYDSIKDFDCPVCVVIIRWKLLDLVA
jgi:hypothetical protein